jgi:predicted RNA binding protein YcfA (HicA-like mRNA interferase family)
MPVFGPISRADLVKGLRVLGFEGPFAGSKHQFMIRDTMRLRIPNPHEGDVSRDLLHRILKQGNISKVEWEQV